MSGTPADRTLPTLSAGRYAIERKLGDGGHAVVYRVLDKRLGVRRAVKVMLADAARRPKLRARFEQEAHTIAAIDHPNVVRVYDVVTDGAVPYLVMELLSGTLSRWLDLHGTMPPGLATSCVRMAGLGLLAAHQQGVIHRDVKPHNLLVSATGVCKLIDFGIARVGDFGRTRAGAAMGTQGYMAPEQARDSSKVDVRVDVFSLGMTLFVLGTGRDPLERVAGRGLELLPEPLRALVDRATAYDRDHRHPDVTTFLAELDEAIARLPPDPASAPLPLPEDDGLEVDLDELAKLGEERKTPSPSAPASAPRVLPYAVPRQVKVDPNATPDWIAAEPAAAPEGFEVRLDPAPGVSVGPEPSVAEESSEAPTVEGGTVGSEGSDAPPEPLGRRLADLVLRVIFDPWRVVPLLLFVTLPLLAVPMLPAEGPGPDSEVRAARAALDAVALDPGNLAAATAIGGDPDHLRALHEEWRTTTEEPARTVALKRYLEALENEVRQFGISGVPATDRSRQSITRLRAALAEYEAKRHEYEAKRPEASGCGGP